MDTQSVIVGLLVAAAAWYVGRCVWTQLFGLIKASQGKAAPCDACCGCAKDKAPKPASPVTLTCGSPVTLPPHIEAMRRSKRADQDDSRL